MPRGDPRFESAKQRPDAYEAVVDEELRDLRGRRFVRARAVEDDLAIARKFLDVLLEAVHGQMQRARDVTRLERAGNLRSHVHDEWRLSGIHETVQLVDTDPGHAQHLVEAVPLPPLERYVADHDRDDDQDRDTSIALQVRKQALDLGAEQHPAAHTRYHPQRPADSVEDKERQPADARRACERRREQRDTRNELGDEQRVESPALEAL